MDAVESLKASWWIVTGPIAAACAAIYWWLKTQFVTKKEFSGQMVEGNEAVDALCKVFATHSDETDERLTKLETTVAHLPSAESFQRLLVMVEKQGTMIETMRETQRGTSEGVKRIEEYFIKKVN